MKIGRGFYSISCSSEVKSGELKKSRREIYYFSNIYCSSTDYFSKPLENKRGLCYNVYGLANTNSAGKISCYITCFFQCDMNLVSFINLAVWLTVV